MKSIELVQSAVPIDDEEDIDEDTFEEFVDPWGIIYKPLKVISCFFSLFSDFMFLALIKLSKCIILLLKHMFINKLYYNYWW